MTAAAPSHEKDAMEGKKVSCRAVNTYKGYWKQHNNMHESAKLLPSENNGISMIFLFFK